MAAPQAAVLAAVLAALAPAAPAVRIESNHFDTVADCRAFAATFPGVVVEAEAFVKRDAAPGFAWQQMPAPESGSPDPFPGYRMDGYMQLLEDPAVPASDRGSIDGATLAYAFQVREPGEYFPLVRAAGLDVASDSLWISLDAGPREMVTVDSIGAWPSRGKWGSLHPVSKDSAWALEPDTQYFLTVSGREPNAAIDAIALVKYGHRSTVAGFGPPPTIGAQQFCERYAGTDVGSPDNKSPSRPNTDPAPPASVLPYAVSFLGLGAAIGAVLTARRRGMAGDAESGKTE